jgi:hypothetical protein
MIHCALDSRQHNTEQCVLEAFRERHERNILAQRALPAVDSREGRPRSSRYLADGADHWNPFSAASALWFVPHHPPPYREPTHGGHFYKSLWQHPFMTTFSNLSGPFVDAEKVDSTYVGFDHTPICGRT